MTDEKKIKENLNSKLHYGSGAEIVRRLAERGVERSKAHVSNVLNPNKQAWDIDVITIAQDLLIEQQSGVIKAKERMV
jgi:hypothetical protein